MKGILDKFDLTMLELKDKYGFEFSIYNQKKINNAKVLVIGAGGLGSPVVLYLAGSGIGMLLGLTVGMIAGAISKEENIEYEDEGFSMSL